MGPYLRINNNYQIFYKHEDLGVYLKTQNILLATLITVKKFAFRLRQ